MMQLYSTGDPKVRSTFLEAVFQGLAPDGGLYQPLHFPDLRRCFEDFRHDTPFGEIALRLTTALLGDELGECGAEAVCSRAFPFSPALVRAEEGISVLELFHGPSCAFKDFGASFLAAVMECELAGGRRRAVILTATSGDTGSAVARAFHRKQGIEVVVLYPSGRVSPLQEKQLTTVGDNVHALEVDGSFDDCQRMVKEAFVDKKLSGELPLTSANSINIGRLLPQAFYYAYAWARVKDRSGGTPPEIWFSVPSGNFGNLTAGVTAWRWGMGVEGFIAATNANDVVPRFLESGIYRPRPSVKTYSNAMDVGNPSNFERLTALFDGDWERIRRWVRGDIVSDAETLEQIRAVHERTGMVLDPHSAVGYLCGERLLDELASGGRRPSNIEVVTLATAHPAKFLEVVDEAIGVKPDIPPQIAGVLDKPKRSTPIDNSVGALSAFLLDTLR